MDELHTRHNFSFGPFDFIFTELSEMVVGFATKKVRISNNAYFYISGGIWPIEDHELRSAMRDGKLVFSPKT